MKKTLVTIALAALSAAVHAEPDRLTKVKAFCADMALFAKRVGQGTRRGQAEGGDAVAPRDLKEDPVSPVMGAIIETFNDPRLAQVGPNQMQITLRMRGKTPLDHFQAHLRDDSPAHAGIGPHDHHPAAAGQRFPAQAGIAL